MATTEIKIDALKAIYSEQMSYAKHHENLREKTTQIILIISGILIAFTKNEFIEINPSLTGTSLFVLGMFAAIICLAHYSKHQEHYVQAHELQTRIYELSETKDIKKEVKAKREKTRKKFAWLKLCKLNTLWVGLNILVAVFGLYLIYGSICD